MHNTNPGNPATVADFRLDQYEVTVGRFRAFVTAFETEAWRPTPGSGIHTAVNDGERLDMVEDGGTLSETGWSSSWDALLDLPNGLMMCGDPTWGPLPGAHEGDPINCLNWYEAYAFCIWDGGFLPSEAEWDYAAAGGGGGLGQRLYPWSVPSSDASIDCTYANYADAGTGGTCSPDSPVAVGSYPKGAGRWGQMDLSGNVSEFTLDFFPGYPLPCNNCANLIQQQDAGRVLRGGGFRDQYFNLYSAARYYTTATPESDREANYGVRCARNP